MSREIQTCLADVQELHLDNVRDQIEKEFPDFDLEKNSCLIEDYLTLRNLKLSEALSFSEEAEANRVFNNKHSGDIYDPEVVGVFNFITGITEISHSEGKRT